MDDETTAVALGWFAELPPDDVDAASEAITSSTATDPDDWPSLAVEAGCVETVDEYYDWLQEAAIQAVTVGVREREQATDEQLKHAIRAMDDCRRTANELAERLSEWGGTIDPDAGTGVDYARELMERASGESENGQHSLPERSDDSGPTNGTPDLDDGRESLTDIPVKDSSTDARTAHQSLAKRIVDLDAEADRLGAYVETHAATVAPNLVSLSGPVLAARLISHAGSLEALAKKPSGTIQVLGAEDALFAHLRGHAPSPKHGIIYTHEAVRGTRHEDRGSAARALAGKLAIAARIDHYSGEYRPSLERELAERLATIRARAVEPDDCSTAEEASADE